VGTGWFSGVWEVSMRQMACEGMVVVGFIGK